jgi:hypothetical protein
LPYGVYYITKWQCGYSVKEYEISASKNPPKADLKNKVNSRPRELRDEELNSSKIKEAYHDKKKNQTFPDDPKNVQNSGALKTARGTD